MVREPEGRRVRKTALREGRMGSVAAPPVSPRPHTRTQLSHHPLQLAKANAPLALRVKQRKHLGNLLRAVAVGQPCSNQLEEGVKVHPSIAVTAEIWGGEGERRDEQIKKRRRALAIALTTAGPRLRRA